VARVKSLQGICTRCKAEFTKQSITKHLTACHANQPGNKVYVHLRVQGYGIGGEYWMDLAVPADATLQSVDKFLRKTWLECCGHMSAFRIGREELSMSRKVGAIATAGQKLIHEYDFGSTTELQITVVGTIEAEIPGREKVKLLARNVPAQLACDKCGEPAEYLCQECSYDDAGILCRTCAEEHECATPDEGLLRISNSPRCGVCGYEG
jgi:hypothetical protein